MAHITYQFLWSNCQEYYVYLGNLYNSSISNGVVPGELKLAKVMPLFKSGYRLNPSNYRLISLVSHLREIFENFYTSTIDFLINTK